MKQRIQRHWQLLSAAIPLLALQCGAQTEVMFSDNFNTGASPLWGNQRGSWVANGGVYDAQAPSNNPINYSGLPFVVTDFAIDVDINNIGDGGLWLRSDSAGHNGILLVTGGFSWGAPGHGPDPQTGKALYWHAVTNDVAGPFLNVASNIISAPGVENMHLRVTAVGNIYSVFVNGATTPATSLTNNAFRSGNVGLYDYSSQTFDNFVLSVMPCVPPPSGLVGWWPGDDTARDIIGTNHGTLFGGTSFGTGEVGNAFIFDGTSGYVTIPNTAALNPTGPFSVEVWIKANPQQSSADHQFLIVDKSHGFSPPASGWFLQGNADGRVGFGCGNGGSDPGEGGFPNVITPSSMLDNQWHHLAGVFTGTQLELYVDGTLQSTLALGIPPAGNNREMEIGRWWNGGNPTRYFHGLIDEVSFYGRALSASEVAAIFSAGSSGKCKPPTITQQPKSQTVLSGTNVNLSALVYGTEPFAYQWLKDSASVSGANNSTITITNAQVSDSGYYNVVVTNLYGAVTSSAALLRVVTNSFELGMVAYYPFNGNASDESGNGLDGTVLGATPTADRFGLPSSAYSFNGSSDYISISSSPLLQMSTNLTISFWMKSTHDGMMICKGNGECAYSVGGNIQVGIGFNHQNINNLVFSKPPTPSNRWFQVVCTLNGTDARIYFNGQLNNAGTGETLGTGTGALTIGKIDSGQPSYYDGLLDDIRIYNRALSAQEVKGLHDFEFPDADHDGLSDWEEINVYHTDPNKKDTDGDGLTDWQEVNVYHTDPNKTDTDNDGFNDYAEIYSGHDPLNITDFPAANLSVFTAIELEFIAKNGTTYEIQASPDLTTWTNFDGPILGDGNIWKKTYSIRGTPKLFYRVELVP